MNDGRTYWDAEAEAKAKQHKRDRPVSDAKNLYTLKAPLELRDIVRNDMGEPAEYLFARPDGSEHELIGCGEDYVKRVFQPLDVEAKRQQIKTIIAKAQKHPSFEEKKREAENSGLSNNASFRSLQQKQLNEAVDAVLRVCGLTQEEQ